MYKDVLPFYLLIQTVFGESNVRALQAKPALKIIVRDCLRGAILLLTIMLVSCSTVPGISVYSLTDEALEAVLLKQIPNLSQRLSFFGMPLNFAVENLSIDIGSEQRQSIMLEVDAIAELSAFLIKYPVDMRLVLEGQPEFDNQQDAIFLRNLNLLDASVNAGAYRGNINGLNREVLDFINSYLNQHPIYRLDKNDPRQALLASIPIDLKIQQGRLSLVPQLTGTR